MVTLQQNTDIRYIILYTTYIEFLELRRSFEMMRYKTAANSNCEEIKDIMIMKNTICDLKK